MNDSLRRAMFRAHLTEEDIATRLAVDPKTVRRWLDGRVPYPRHRWQLMNVLGSDEDELWPGLDAARSRPAEIAAVYSHRSSVSNDSWRELYKAAEHEIDILAYSGLFLAENPEVRRMLAAKAASGVRIRIALGDPDSPHVADRGTAEEIGEAMAAKVRNALILYRPIAHLDGVQLRLHRTVLYNSIYRADDQLLVNQHIYGIPAAHAPVCHLRRSTGGEMFQSYLDSFERIWATATEVNR
jgi:transcriptional regulator with XRE-family HTH domain